jgi:hypothetical protein
LSNFALKLRNLTFKISEKLEKGVDMESKGKVVWENYYSYRRIEAVKIVLEEYALKLGVKIVVNSTDGDETSRLSKPRHQKNTLFVNIHSGPSIGIFSSYHTSGELVREVFDYSLGEDSYHCSPVGIKIMDDNQVVAAEVIEGTLFVLINLLPADVPDQIMREIMEEYVKSVPKELSDRRKIVKQNIARVRKNSWNNFIKIFRRSEDGKLERNRKLIRERYDELKATVKRGRLIVLPDGEIHADLGYITHHEYGEKTYLGEVLLVIETNDEVVKVYGLSTQKSTNIDNHPHVWGDGDMCLGNIDSGIDKLLEQKQYAFVVETMIDYMETA